MHIMVHSLLKHYRMHHHAQSRENLDCYAPGFLFYAVTIVCHPLKQCTPLQALLIAWQLRDTYFSHEVMTCINITLKKNNQSLKW